MPPELETAPAVGGAPESTTPEVVSTPSAESQASGSAEPTTPTTEATETPKETPAEKPDWKKLLREDPEARKALQDEANKIAQRNIARQERRALREQATKAVEAEDADTALDVARRIAAQQDDDDEADLPPSQRKGFAEARTKADPHLHATFADFGPEAKALYEQHRDTWQERYDADPMAMAQWVRTEAINARVQAEAKKQAVTLAKAIATEQTNTALQGVQTPMSGSGAGSDDAAFLELYSSGRSNDHARAEKLLKNLK